MPPVMDLALAHEGSDSKPSGFGSVRHRGNFWQVITEANPVPPRYQNLSLQTQHTWFRIIRHYSSKMLLLDVES